MHGRAHRSLFVALSSSQDMASRFLSGPAESKWPPVDDVTNSRAPHAIGTTHRSWLRFEARPMGTSYDERIKSHSSSSVQSGQKIKYSINTREENSRRRADRQANGLYSERAVAKVSTLAKN